MNIHAECVTTAAAIATALPHQQQAMEKQTIEKVFRSHLHRASNCNCCNKWITTTTTTENIAVTVNFFAIVSRHLQSAKSILHVQRFAAIKVIARCSMNLNVRTNNFFIAAAAQQQWNVLALFVLKLFFLSLEIPIFDLILTFCRFAFMNYRSIPIEIITIAVLMYQFSFGFTWTFTSPSRGKNSLKPLENLCATIRTKSKPFHPPEQLSEHNNAYNNWLKLTRE